MKRVSIAALAVVMAIIAIGVLPFQKSEAFSDRVPTRDTTSVSQTSSMHIVLLYGWRGKTTSWDTAKADYEAQGYTVHVLRLPYSGLKAGDTAKNAAFVYDYIATNGLTDVKLDGHSLGGWLALFVAFGCSPDPKQGCTGQNPAVSSVVLRDTGTGCFWGQPPDQCDGSALRVKINSAPKSAVPILEVKTSITVVPPQVDCIQIRDDLEHNDFLSDHAVTAMAIGWPGVNPCVAAAVTQTVTATPSPTATPCPRYDWVRDRCR